MSDDQRADARGQGPGAGGKTSAVNGTAATARPFADCVLCQEPTEYPESYKGITLCPVCAWQEAQRTACSG